MSKDFTQNEAKAFVGKTFEILLEYAGLPKGTRGLVIGADKMGEGYSVVLQWELQVRLETRMLPLRYWMTKVDVQRFLQEVQP